MIFFTPPVTLAILSSFSTLRINQPTRAFVLGRNFITKSHLAESKMDKTGLIERINQGEKPKYFFFWGHKAKSGGDVGKECFSQWYESSFQVDDVEYATAEHYMMAEKARLFGDDAMLPRIISAKSPGEAKKLGRLVDNFDEAVWREHRFDIVVRGNVAKFNQNETLKHFLLQTGDKILVEASPRDRIWGIGMGASNENALDPTKWRGLNLLGFALMTARAELTPKCEAHSL